MRIAAVSQYVDLLGGIEYYLARLLPALAERGHAVGFWHVEGPQGQRQTLLAAKGIDGWCIQDLGETRALAELAKWRPEVLYVHGLADPGLESRLLGLAPGVFFAHNYYGTCVSGLKAHKFPVVRPCQKHFGWRCLFHYYPRRCGGWSPLTLWRDYLRQKRRLAVLGRYRFILTHSAHMRSELLQHGLAPDRVAQIPFYVPAGEASLPAVPSAHATWRLLFLGRLDFLKGGHVFLDCLPGLSGLLARPLEVVFAGDGPQRARLEALARTVAALTPKLDIRFTGWLNARERDMLLAQSDLLVMPSLWPEPFGQAGIEAGRWGIPAAAFALGGIPDWLQEGVNGHLAPADPPSPEGLAAALVQCLADPKHHAELRRGAVRVAAQFGLDQHLPRLEEYFKQAQTGVAPHP